MDPEAGTLEAFYASPIQHPGLLWLAAGNLLVLRLAWDEIPDRAFGISTGKQSVTLATLNVGLSAMALVGLGLLIRDVRRPKEEQKEEGMTPPPT